LLVGAMQQATVHEINGVSNMRVIERQRERHTQRGRESERERLEALD
jgi:hypothetical protein